MMHGVIQYFDEETILLKWDPKTRNAYKILTEKHKKGEYFYFPDLYHFDRVIIEDNRTKECKEMGRTAP